MSVTWLSEQTGVALPTMLKHYGRFVHPSQADDFEMAKFEMARIEDEKGPRRYNFDTKLDTGRLSKRKLNKFNGLVVSPTGFEPVLPT